MYQLRQTLTGTRFAKTLQNSPTKLDILADLDQQQEPVHPQVKSNEPTTNENNFPPGKPPAKANPYQQLYRSKPSTNNSIELFIKSIEKNFFNPIILEKF